MLALGALVIHTFFERESPKVDQTTALLLAVALLAPFLPKLKALEIAGAKAEWRDQAAIGLTEITRVLRLQHEALSAVFSELTRLSSGVDVISAQENEVVVLRRPIERLLWVDDRPEGNYYEMESLQDVVSVEICRTTVDALESLKTGDIDAVISDIARVEDGVRNERAGVQLSEAIQSMATPPPLFIYSSAHAVERHRDALLVDGAEVVTASFGELVSALRRRMALAFEAAVFDLLLKRASNSRR